MYLKLHIEINLILTHLHFFLRPIMLIKDLQAPSIVTLPLTLYKMSRLCGIDHNKEWCIKCLKYFIARKLSYIIYIVHGTCKFYIIYSINVNVCTCKYLLIVYVNWFQQKSTSRNLFWPKENSFCCCIWKANRLSPWRIYLGLFLCSLIFEKW